MEYEWEEEAKGMVRKAIEPDAKFEVIGVAVANTETGEAAYFEYQDNFKGIELADYLKDVLGDVEERYSESVKNMMEKTNEWIS